MKDTLLILRLIVILFAGFALNIIVNAVGGLDSKEGIVTLIVGLIVGTILIFVTNPKEDN